MVSSAPTRSCYACRPDDEYRRVLQFHCYSTERRGCSSYQMVEERLAYTDRSAMQFCFIRHVPAGVNINQRGWTQPGVYLFSWTHYPAAWRTEGVGTLVASVPSPHERLYLSMLCTPPLDDGNGTLCLLGEQTKGSPSLCVKAQGEQTGYTPRFSSITRNLRASCVS